jgi:hypothetical protein
MAIGTPASLPRALGVDGVGCGEGRLSSDVQEGVQIAPALDAAERGFGNRPRRQHASLHLVGDVGNG